MNIHNQSYIQRCCTDNNLFELKLLNVFDINPIPDYLNIAAQYGNLNIIKFYIFKLIINEKTPFI